MEGVGARLGRSSTRYGPTTVFTGPVRKWKKKWVHASAFNSNNHDHQTPNGNANGSSHLLFYKWTVITPSQNKDNNGGDSNNGNNNVSSNGDSKNSDKVDSFAVEEPPKRKFKYIPIAVLEEQKNELSEQVEDEAKPIEFDANAEESTDNSPEERQDLNESTTFGLNENNGDNESDSKTDQSERQPQPV